MECGDCKKQFVRYSDLRRHIKRFHSNALEQLAPLKRSLKSYDFKCGCGKNFSHKKNFDAHSTLCIKQDSGVSSVNSNRFKKCPLCAYVNPLRNNLHDHFLQAHDIEIIIKSLTFNTFEEFNSWMSTIEKATKSKFVKYRGQKDAKIDYHCHRSGFFNSKSKGLRNIKTQGSNKIDGLCPAKIEVQFDENNVCNVKFVETHVGHQLDDLGHLFLTNSERQSLAVKIASKIPFPTIIEDIRDRNSNGELNRLDLLTRKDLYNIEATYNLMSGAVRHKNDAVSVDAWVREMEAGNSCVLLYKPQDSILDDYPELKKKDFVLCIMNDGQFQVLRKFCNDVVCVDGTHGLNSYQFELHTLLVLDDLRQGFPCAFFISNRSDQEMFKLFFKVIKEHIGMTIKPKVFMSDLAPAYYNAWMTIMGEPDRRLFCSWHVLRAWHKNLNDLISSKEKQDEVSTMLRTVLEETDEQAFQKIIANFISKLAADKETADFSNYFRDNYLKNTASWAYCYRLHCGLNTNMHLERMHGTIKYIYLNGKNVKRLDKTITALMRFVKDKVFERIIALYKGKVSSKLADLRSRHKTSLKLDTNLVTENSEGWDFPSASKSFEIYNIQKNDISCDCALTCKHCGSCIHQYSCTCLDSGIKWNMCKHIHVVCRYLNEKLEDVNNIGDNEETNSLFIHCEPKKEEARLLKESLAKIVSENGGSIDEEKEQIKQHLISVVDNIKTKEQMEALKKLIAPIEATMSAVLQQSEPLQDNQAEADVKSKTPANKKILPQRRFYTTKKSRINKKKILIKKVSQEERDKIALALLQ